MPFKSGFQTPSPLRGEEEIRQEHREDKTRFTKLAVVLFFASSYIGLAQAYQNQCVQCHKEISKTNMAQPSHDFAEWESSIHAGKGVTCEACHGGSPEEKEIQAAHRGIVPSTNPQSRIYFNRIPETCGSCHKSELEGFESSDHYKELQSSGKGPNCVTCHSSMATQVLSPKEMEMVCTLCHRRPTQAYGALLSLQMSGKLVGQLEQKIMDVKGERLDLSKQALDLKDARKNLNRTHKLWHSFDMAKVLAASQDLNHKIRNSLQEIELKQKSRGK